MSDLREILLDITPNEEAIDEFLAHVEGINREATSRIARAINAHVEESTDETLVEETVEDETEEVIEEVVEVVEVVEEVEEEVTEEVEVEVEVVEENEETVIELAEDFLANVVSDVVADDVFGEAIRTAVNQAVEKVRAEFEERLRSLKTEVETVVEKEQDAPARQKRTVVSYRPRQRNIELDTDNIPDDVEVITATDVANSTLDNMFGGK